ncbi:MAG: SDR family NAD(P)-dependent oxidoreductase [Actinomycetota bacterium]|nr:SDR family NAD(P)-dependent oxidoreductase [Actinomycetota bacterium]
MPLTPSPRLAVVTGASSGIGLELAKQFAEHGFDLVVTAEDAELTQAARELESLGTHVESLRVDLARPEGVEELVGFVLARSRPVDALALNAGIGAGGKFASETELDQELKLIDLNVRSTVHLAKRILPGMIERGEGRVLITSSIASTMPGAHHAVYNASKSFTQSFAAAIREELDGTGVTVTSLMPGPTDTEFFERADLEHATMAAKRDPAGKVAQQGFEAMMNGEEKVVAGSPLNRVQAKVAAVVPDSLKAKVHGKLTQKD